MNPLSATIEIAADGSEGLRYLTWPKEYIVEHEPKPEVSSETEILLRLGPFSFS